MKVKCRPKVIVLCGSSKFVDIMAVVAWLLERDEGAITMSLHLLPYWYCREDVPDHLAEQEGVSEAMDNLHLRKIDLADSVFIVNVDDYIGESTHREIEYALMLKKPIRWFNSDPVGDKIMAIITEFAKDNAATKAAGKEG